MLFPEAMHTRLCRFKTNMFSDILELDIYVHYTKGHNVKVGGTRHECLLLSAGAYWKICSLCHNLVKTKTFPLTDTIKGGAYDYINAMNL